MRAYNLRIILGILGVSISSLKLSQRELTKLYTLLWRLILWKINADCFTFLGRFDMEMKTAISAPNRENETEIGEFSDVSFLVSWQSAPFLISFQMI